MNTPLDVSGSNSDASGNQSGTESNTQTVFATPLPAADNSSPGAYQDKGISIKGKVSDVEGAMKDLNARTVGNEIVVELPSDMLFDFDKYDIRPDAADALERLLTIINTQASGGAIRIEGHTDSIATDAYNQTLSERRDCILTFADNKKMKVENYSPSSISLVPRTSSGRLSNFR